MKSSTKRILNILFIITIFALVLYIGFKGNDPKQIYTELKSIPLSWLLILMTPWLLYMITETISMHIFFKMQGFKVSALNLFKIVIMGNYYSSITPASTGGQPMQVYYLKKCGVPVGISTSVLTVRFFIYQLSLLTLGLVFWILNPEFVSKQLGSKIWVVYFGFFFNSLTVVGVVLIAINGKVTRFLTFGTIKLLHKIKLIRHLDKNLTRAQLAIENFEDSVRIFRKEPVHLIIQFVITCVQFIFLFLCTYLIYICFNLSGTSIIEMLTIATLLFISASYTPLPGASGAQEGGFVMFYNGIFPSGTIFSALLLWRFFTYYTMLLIGFVLSLIGFKSKEPEVSIKNASNVDNE